MTPIFAFPYLNVTWYTDNYILLKVMYSLNLCRNFLVVMPTVFVTTPRITIPNMKIYLL